MREGLSGFDVAQERLSRELGVRLGIPALPPEQAAIYARQGISEQIALPHAPHVFFAKEVVLKTWDKQRRGTIRDLTTLNNVMVMMGHGYEISRTQGDWMFSTGRSVEETADSYQKIALEMSLPQVDIVLACRGSEIVPPPLPPAGVKEVRKVVPIQVRRMGEGQSYVVPADYVGTYSRWTKSGEGVDSITAISESWTGYQRYQGRTRTPSNIPQWAKEASVL